MKDNIIDVLKVEAILLEDKMLNLLNQFQQKTGMRVSRIDIEETKEGRFLNFHYIFPRSE